MLLGRIIFAALFFFLSGVSSYAQNMGNVIAVAAQGIQSGNLTMFGWHAAQKLRNLLGFGLGAVLYQRLASLGPVGNVVILQQFPMPNGIVTQGRAIHQNGFSDWTIGFSYLTQKIEFGQFNAVQTTSTPTSPIPIESEPTTPPVPTTQDEACKKYPTLC
jgi:hypothetical protein